MELVVDGGSGVMLSFEAFYERERPAMLRLAHLMTGSVEAGEDIVHDSFIAVHGRFAALAEPGAYLRKTVVNRCLNSRGRTAMERSRLQLVDRPMTSDDTEDPLWDALSGLPQSQRVAIVLTYYLDLTSTEAATVMRCRPATVRSLVHRALRALRLVVQP